MSERGAGELEARLLVRASQGDAAARDEILSQHRDRLRRMISLRMDSRLQRRLDPSDVIQEAMITAWQELPVYLQDRAVPLYPWLRAIAWRRLIDLHRRHIGAEKRSVAREKEGGWRLPDASSAMLAARFVSTSDSPQEKLLRAERESRIRKALELLSESQREVLILRYLEGLSVGESAAVLGLSEMAVKKRHVRALQSLRERLEEDLPREERA